MDTIFDVVSLAVSVIEVITNPTDITNWIGLAGDVIDLIPGVTGVGETTRACRIGANAVEEAVDTATSVARRGWKVGDDINLPTRTGADPTWGTAKRRYWKNEAHYNSRGYTPENIARMRQGKAPLVQHNNGKWYPTELHHKIP